MEFTGGAGSKTGEGQFIKDLQLNKILIRIISQLNATLLLLYEVEKALDLTNVVLSMNKGGVNNEITFWICENIVCVRDSLITYLIQTYDF